MSSSPAPRRAFARRLGTFAAAGIVAITVTAGLVTSTGVAVHADAEPMTLISQELALAPDAPLTITFQTSAPLEATDSIVIGAYQLVDDRAELPNVIAGEYGRIVDSIDLAAADPAVVVSTGDNQVTVTVPTASTGSLPGSLQLSRSGLYPVTVDVVDAAGAVVGDLLTFVDRTAAAPEADEGAIQVSVLASITAPPQVPGEDTPLPPEVLDQVNELIQYPASVPLSISISPDVLGRLDAKTMAELQPVLARSALLSQPSIPLDPSAAVAADEGDLFTSMLQSGEDITTEMTGTVPTRTVWVEHDPITTEGAALLRTIGVNLIVLTPETYAQVPVESGNIGRYTLYSRLRDVQLPSGTVPVALFDPEINRHLVDDELSPEMAAIYTAADLAAWRDWIDDNVGPVAGNSVVLGLPAGGVLGHDRVARLVELAESTGVAEFTDVTTLLRTTDAQLVDDAPITLTLAPQQPVDLAARAGTIADLAAREATVTSMLVDDTAGRSDRWKRTIQTLQSSSITDAQVSATAAQLGQEFQAITSCVEGPDSFNFRMNGQATTLHANILNRCEEPLTVRVQLSATQGKMEFPDGDVVEQTLDPGVINDVRIRVLARSNGSSTIFLRIYAPDQTVPIAAQTVIKAEVSALTGLAQVLTGGALLILITWWVRNLRRSRRQRRSEVALTSHPARPKQPSGVPAPGAAVAAVLAEVQSPTGSGGGNVNTATTSNATVTAATTIAALDTSDRDAAGPVDGESTTLSDS